MACTISCTLENTEQKYEHHADLELSVMKKTFSGASGGHGNSVLMGGEQENVHRFILKGEFYCKNNRFATIINTPMSTCVFINGFFQLMANATA